MSRKDEMMAKILAQSPEMIATISRIANLANNAGISPTEFVQAITLFVDYSAACIQDELDKLKSRHDVN